MNPIITLPDFQCITTTHGTEKGQAYFDAQESLVHTIFPDRIEFCTNFVEETSYEVSFHDEALCVKKMRLDNKATVVVDTMEKDDWEELEQLCRQMVNELIRTPKLSEMDVQTELDELFAYLFTESEAEAYFQKLPKKKKPDLERIWKQLSSALEQAGMLAGFEWKEWLELGVMEVNGLAPLRQLGIELPYPTKAEVKAVNDDPDWERAVLQYFNAHLDVFDLKLLAIGNHFDEYQTFACLSMRDLSLLNALEKFNQLRIVYKY